MRLTVDTKADAAYLRLVDDIQPGESVRTIVCEDPGLSGMVVVDIDAAGHVLGIEFVGARALLRSETLGGAGPG
jgi:uncharacterized protein YuzE